MLYLWIKALHIVAVIAWMAALLYLPRLLVYHAGAARGSAQSETFKVMERRLLKAIANPAMIVAWLAGLFLAYERETGTGMAGSTPSWRWFWPYPPCTGSRRAGCDCSPPTPIPIRQDITGSPMRCRPC